VARRVVDGFAQPIFDYQRLLAIDPRHQPSLNERCCPADVGLAARLELEVEVPAIPLEDHQGLVVSAGPGEAQLSFGRLRARARRLPTQQALLAATLVASTESLEQTVAGDDQLPRREQSRVTDRRLPRRRDAGEGRVAVVEHQQRRRHARSRCDVLDLMLPARGDQAEKPARVDADEAERASQRAHAALESRHAGERLHPARKPPSQEQGLIGGLDPMTCDVDRDREQRAVRQRQAPKAVSTTSPLADREGQLAELALDPHPGACVACSRLASLQISKIFCDIWKG